MSSDEAEACPGCGAGVLYDDMYKCYGCYYVGCQKCGFDSNGECTVCADEEEAWDTFDDARMEIDSIDHPDDSVQAALKSLVQYMEQWKEKVECGKTASCAVPTEGPTTRGRLWTTVATRSRARRNGAWNGPRPCKTDRSVRVSPTSLLGTASPPPPSPAASSTSSTR